MVNYKTVGKIVKNGNRIGFVLETLDNQGKTKQVKVSDKQLINLMNTGNIIDLTLDKRGFKFKDRSKRISDLPVIFSEARGVDLTKNKRHNALTYEYTGDSLRELCLRYKVDKLKSRDFVKAIKEYSNLNELRILAISGLRGTGKTTGILQAIYDMNLFNEAVFITIDEKAVMDCLDLRELVWNKYKNKKYIFIDEITRIMDIINNSGFLCDAVSASGHRVIISGTDSLGLVKSEGAGLYHRVINLNVTQITFAEAQRTMNQSLVDYVQLGGLYNADSIADIEGVRRYIDTAVVDNIQNTLTKNKGVTGLLGLEDISSKRKLRTIVFRLIYGIICSNLVKSRITSVKQLINLFDYSSSSVYNAANLNSLVCREMMVDEKLQVTQIEVESVMNALVELGLVVKIYNLANRQEFNCYITNPSIVNQLVGSVITILDKTKLPKIKNATIKSINGQVYESVVVTHTKKVADKFGNKTYYYRDSSNREVDLIVAKHKPSLFEEYILYYEIKMTSDSDTAVVKSKWINDEDIEKFMNSTGVVLGKGIIYTGKNDKFTGFKDRNTYPPKGMTLSQIEQQNMGIELISAVDYLTDPYSKLKILETYEID